MKAHFEKTNAGQERMSAEMDGFQEMKATHEELEACLEKMEANSEDMKPVAENHAKLYANSLVASSLRLLAVQ